MASAMVKRNILLNPGPATTTNSVKMAQVVPDICPREKEFADIMRDLGKDLVEIAHGNVDDYTAVLFCGSGTLNIDVCVSSLVPENKKILILNNGSYSARAVEVASYYHINHIDLQLPTDRPIDLAVVQKALEENSDIAVVYCCMHETGTGILNPVKEIGALAHNVGAIMVSDTTSAYGLIPIDLKRDNLDFIMASAQKGLMSMTGLSFVIGKTKEIEKSAKYPTRSYYSNLYLQYSFIRDKGEMHFTPPVQTIYATKQAIKEYFEEGEKAKQRRHREVWETLWNGIHKLGFKTAYPKEYMSGLVVPVMYPKYSDGREFSFQKFHDGLYEKGFTIYPGKVEDVGMFRLCSLGAIYVEDAENFLKAAEEVLKKEDLMPDSF
ncbi:MAG: 2-aminoethylphosphonate aminotransferase [Clostridia bacterium]|nr:2-aminoethylphosphonate aminotransferase [Clostridia bacterium]